MKDIKQGLYVDRVQDMVSMQDSEIGKGAGSYLKDATPLDSIDTTSDACTAAPVLDNISSERPRISQTHTLGERA